jgi:AcrR family transcriptional regulator
MAAMPRDVKRRTYDRSGRQAQSRATKQRIIDVARDLMVERGYRATTVSEIARQSGVHVDTVYELVGRKPVLLRELIEQALSGTDHAVPAEDRAYVAAIRAEPEPARKLAIYAAAVRDMQARLAPLFLALRDASATEPEAQQVWQTLSDRRAANMRKLAEDLRDAGGLRPGLSIDEAADTIWATNSSELYVLLTVERGWPPDRYERWLADTWQRLLLPDNR